MASKKDIETSMDSEPSAPERAERSGRSGISLGDFCANSKALRAIGVVGEKGFRYWCQQNTKTHAESMEAWEAILKEFLNHKPA